MLSLFSRRRAIWAHLFSEKMHTENESGEFLPRNTDSCDSRISLTFLGQPLVAIWLPNLQLMQNFLLLFGDFTFVDMFKQEDKVFRIYFNKLLQKHFTLDLILSI